MCYIFIMNTYFSNSNPVLTNIKTVKNMEHLFLIKDPVKEQSLGSVLGSFYQNIIEPNLFVLLLFVVLILFMLFRFYYMSDDFKEEEQEDFRPTFNPSLPIKSQQSFVRYMPDEVPVIAPNGEYVTNNDIDPPIRPVEKYPPFIHTTQDRDVFTGTHDTYQNHHDPLYNTNYLMNDTSPYSGQMGSQLAMDHTIPSSFNWPTNFNSTTGSAVGWMTGRARQNLHALDEQLYNDEYNMITAPQYGNGNEWRDSGNMFTQAISRPYAE